MEQDYRIEANRKGKHLTKGERGTIEVLSRNGHLAQDIATKLDRHRRTIERELVRGRVKHKDTNWKEKMVYSSDRGQAVYDENATAKGPQLKLGKNWEMVEFVRSRILEHRESPAVIAFRMASENMEGSVSAKTIYSYVDKGLFYGVTNESLWEKRQRKQRGRRTIRRSPKTHTKRLSIDERPEHIENRKEFGHWEIDLIVGPVGSKASILTLLERKTRMMFSKKLKNKTNGEVVRALNGIERELGTGNFVNIFKSITADNGSEFLNVDKLQTSRRSSKQRTCVYYAHPYASWERGSNENGNKMFRRFIAKGQKIEEISRASIKEVEQWINNYPRKIIDYRSASELFEKEMEGMTA